MHQQDFNAILFSIVFVVVLFIAVVVSQGSFGAVCTKAGLTGVDHIECVQKLAKGEPIR